MQVVPLGAMPKVTAPIAKYANHLPSVAQGEGAGVSPDAFMWIGPHKPDSVSPTSCDAWL